jgi:hypothetical protein
MAALATGLKDVRAAVQEAVEKKGGSWDDGDWSVFVGDVVSFLLKQGETRSRVVAAAAGLIVYGATTQEKLQVVAGQPPDDEKFMRKLAAKGVPDAICDMLFGEYVSKKKRSASGTLTSARPVKRALHDGEGRFFASITNLANETGSWRLFQENIIASRDQPFLYIRECYEPLYARLWDELTAVDGVPQAVVRSDWVDRTTERNTRRRHVGAIVTGTSGIGKTFLGIEVVRRLVKEKKCTVLYNFRNERRFVIAPSRKVLSALPEGDPRKAILHIDEFRGAELMEGESEADLDDSCWWGELKLGSPGGTDLYETLKGLPAVWLLVDLHSETYTDGHPRCHVVIFTSFRPDKVKGFADGASGAVMRLYMPPWTVEETVACINSWSGFAISEAEVRQRFAKYGGSARMMFMDPSDAASSMASAYYEAEKAGIVHVFTADGQTPTISSKFVHAFPTADFRAIDHVDFVSEEVRDDVVAFFLEKTRVTEQLWLEATAGLKVDRTARFELLWHAWAQSPAKKPAVRLKFLGGGFEAAASTNKAAGPRVAGSAVVFDAKLCYEQAHRTVRLQSNDIKTMEAFSVGQYLKPRTSNFAGIDGLGVYEGPLWTSQAAAARDPPRGVTLVLWQMTIVASNRHPMQGQVIVDLITHIKALLAKHGKLITGIVLLYAVENIDEFPFQAYRTADNKCYKKVPTDVHSVLDKIEQYAVALPRSFTQN